MLLSAEHYGRLLATQRAAAQEPAPCQSPEARAFYEKHKEWVDEQHAHFRKYGIWNDEFRAW